MVIFNFMFAYQFHRPKPYVVQTTFPSDIFVRIIGLEQSISKAVQHLFDLMDMNWLTPGEDYKINIQGSRKPYWKEDKEIEPLFSFVNECKLHHHTFIALLDNYSSECGSTETVSHAESNENMNFIRSIMLIAPMQFCHKHLSKTVRSIWATSL